MKKLFDEIFNPDPADANRSLLLVALFWGTPSLAMLLLPAFKWTAERQLSVAEFACMAFGLVLLCAYTRFIGAFIGRYMGPNWLREQLFGKDPE